MAKTLEWMALVLGVVAVVAGIILQGGQSDLGRSLFIVLAGWSLAVAAVAMVMDGRWRIVPSSLWFVMALALTVSVVQILPGLPGRLPLPNPGWARVMETTAHSLSADRQLTMQSLLVLLSAMALTYVFSSNASTPARLTSMLLICGFTLALSVSYHLASQAWQGSTASEQALSSSWPPFVQETMSGSTLPIWSSMAAVLTPSLVALGILMARVESQWVVGMLCWVVSAAMALLAGVMDIQAGAVAIALAGVIVVPLACRSWRGTAISGIATLSILFAGLVAWERWSDRSLFSASRIAEWFESCQTAWRMLLDHFWLGAGVGTAREILPLYGPTAGSNLGTLTAWCVEVGAISAALVLVWLALYFVRAAAHYHRLDETSQLILAGAMGSILTYMCLAAFTPDLAAPAVIGLVTLVVGVMMRALVNGYERDEEGFA